MSARRIVTMILVNVVVSAVVVLSILYWWENRQKELTETAVESVPIVLPTQPLAVTAVANAAPTPTDTPAPSNEPLQHIVVAGDTLSNISRTYGVPMDDIIAANNIPNPNALDIGQIIYIPVGGVEEPTPVPPTDEPVTAVTITPIPTVPPLTGDINVQIGEVIGVGQLAEEAVQIINRGSGELDLTNWQIRDESGQTYTFGNVKIFGGGAGILLHTETGTDTTSNYYWQLESPVWQSGEKVTLLDADGVEQASYIIP